MLRSASPLRVPSALFQTTNATELVILLEYPDLINRPQLTFPPFALVFSQLYNLSIYSRQHIAQIRSDSLRPFPSLVNLDLTDTGSHWLQPIIPHINLQRLCIEVEVPHFWQSMTIDIAMIAEWFSNLTILILGCNWQIDQQISTSQVVFRRVKVSPFAAVPSLMFMD